MEKETVVTQIAEEAAIGKAEEAVSSAGEVANPQESAKAEALDGSGIPTTANENESVSDSVPIEAVSAESTPDKSAMKAEFERLIKGDYKEFYEERIKENLNRRFRENAAAKRQNRENREIVEMLFDRYSIAPGDIASLRAALDSDDAYLAAEADKRGISIENYKYIKRLEGENRRFMAREAQLSASRKAGETVDKWFGESMKLKESYPDFDIFAEAKNPSFVSLLQSGIDLRTAYEVVHHADIVHNAERRAAREAEIKTAETIRQKATRPAENGLSSKSSAIYANGVSALTPKEREDIARRASRGERIIF